VSVCLCVCVVVGCCCCWLVVGCWLLLLLLLFLLFLLWLKLFSYMFFIYCIDVDAKSPSPFPLPLPRCLSLSFSPAYGSILSAILVSNDLNTPSCLVTVLLTSFCVDTWGWSRHTCCDLGCILLLYQSSVSYIVICCFFYLAS